MSRIGDLFKRVAAAARRRPYVPTEKESAEWAKVFAVPLPVPPKIVYCDKPPGDCCLHAGHEGPCDDIPF